MHSNELHYDVFTCNIIAQSSSPTCYVFFPSSLPPVPSLLPTKLFYSRFLLFSFILLIQWLSLGSLTTQALKRWRALLYISDAFGWVARKYVCAPCTCQVPAEHRWRCQIPWDWSYTLVWVAVWGLGLEPWFSGRASDSNHWVIFPASQEHE